MSRRYNNIEGEESHTFLEISQPQEAGAEIEESDEESSSEEEISLESQELAKQIETNVINNLKKVFPKEFKLAPDSAAAAISAAAGSSIHSSPEKQMLTAVEPLTIRYAEALDEIKTRGRQIETLQYHIQEKNRLIESLLCRIKCQDRLLETASVIINCQAQPSRVRQRESDLSASTITSPLLSSGSIFSGSPTLPPMPVRALPSVSHPHGPAPKTRKL